MAEVKNIKLGNTTPDAIMLDSFSGVADFSLLEGVWEINTGWEVEFIGSRYIKIKKFKTDTWGIRRVINPKTAELNQSQSYQIKVTGLEAVNNIVKFNKAYCGDSGYDTDWRAGKYLSGRYIQGLGIQGGRHNNTNGSGLQMAMHPWDIGYVTNIEDGYIAGSNFDGSFYALTIGLYGGIQDSSSVDYEKIWNIENNPITIDIKANHINPASKECWKVLSNNNIIYNKSKTLDNCWIKYNIANYKYIIDQGVTVLSIDNSSLYTKNSNYLPPLDSLDSLPDNIAWNTPIYNSEYWEQVKAWYTRKIIDGKYLKGRLFADNNMTGKLVLNINSTSSKTFNCEHLFKNSQLSEVEFNFTDDGYIGSCNKMFQSASKLVSVKTNKPFNANDLSGMFEWAKSLVISPKGIISWNSFSNVPYTNIGYCWEGCTSLTTIEQETIDRNTVENTIVFSRYAPQVFNGCSKLQSIGPVLNLKRVVPSTSGNTYNMFAGCASLSDARIKNLNHGDWKLDGSGDLGNLNLLDQSSVKYLFDNLTNLKSEYSANIEDGDLETPIVNSAKLYCPSTWDTYITDAMVLEANTKGWNIYIGGTLVEVSQINSATVTWIPVNDDMTIDTTVNSGTIGSIVFFGKRARAETIASALNNGQVYITAGIRANEPTVYTSFNTVDAGVLNVSDSGNLYYACWDNRLTSYTADDIKIGSFMFSSGQTIEARINSVAFKDKI